MCYIKSRLTTTLDVASIVRLDAIIIAPPAAIDLKDAIVSGFIGVVVDGSGLVL